MDSSTCRGHGETHINFPALSKIKAAIVGIYHAINGKYASSGRPRGVRSRSSAPLGAWPQRPYCLINRHEHTVWTNGVDQPPAAALGLTGAM
jgi:hypothetical protein